MPKTPPIPEFAKPRETAPKLPPPLPKGHRRSVWRILSSHHLPLLQREMTELAARQRTYIIRFLYTVICYGLFLWYYQQEFMMTMTGAGVHSMVGNGAQLLNVIFIIQAVAICILLPPMMSSVITYEKERNALELLFLTDLEPLEVLMQKFYGRLIPMVVYLFISFPLMAMAYAMGGISAGRVLAAAYMLLITAVVVGAFALVMSCYCQTTASAFVYTYLLGIPIFATLQCLGAFPPTSYLVTADFPAIVSFAVSFPACALAVFLLAFARRLLLRRANLREKDYVAAAWTWFLDIWLHLRHIGVAPPKPLLPARPLPDEQPMRWREQTRAKQLITKWYVPHLIVGSAVFGYCIYRIAEYGNRPRWGTTSESIDFSGEIATAWVLCVAVILVRCAHAIGRERDQQTLPVLLTTPLLGADIVREKVAAVLSRSSPFMTVLFVLTLVQACCDYRWSAVAGDVNRWLYLGGSWAAIVLYPPMFAWLGSWWSLQMRTRLTAMLGLLAIAALWSFAPITLADLAGHTRSLSPLFVDLLEAASWISPFTILNCLESHQLDVLQSFPLLSQPVAVVGVNLLGFVGILLMFKHTCLSRADRLLGRTRAEAAPAVRAQIRAHVNRPIPQ